MRRDAGGGSTGMADAAVVHAACGGVAASGMMQVQAVVGTESKEAQECLCQDKRAPADRANHEKARQHFVSNPSVEIRVFSHQ
jgi:hypothetical protein